MAKGEVGLPTCCVIGAGVSGLTTAKALADRGIPFRWFEASGRLGGVWAFKNPNGRSAAYRSLHIDTSKARLQLDDFPAPADLPEYPHHSQVLGYLEAYADRFGLRPRIAFDTEVVRAELDGDGVWRVATGDGARHRFDALFVCNGHHWDPRWPTPAYPGAFAGDQIHVSSYRDPFDPIDVRGKNVLVVGMGNSAMDVACELSPRHLAAKLLVSARRGVHIFPRFMLGQAADKGRVYPWLPLALQRGVSRVVYRKVVGRMEDYGLPKPDHPIFASHGTVSDEFPSRVAAGDIAMRPAIERLDGGHVVFKDGRRDPVDLIVWATGYNVSFPFLAADFLAAVDNRLPLFKRVIRPGIPNLFFIGLLQSSVTVFTPAERQARWIASYLCGDYALPGTAAMERTIVADEARHMSRYYPSARHTMQVDQDVYFWELDRERRAGARRARALGYGPGRLPVPAKAAGLADLAGLAPPEALAA